MRHETDEVYKEFSTRVGYAGKILRDSEQARRAHVKANQISDLISNQMRRDAEQRDQEKALQYKLEQMGDVRI